MTGLMVVLRLTHIVLGVFWAGTIFFMVTFVQPVLGESGPEAGRFMQRLRKRGFFEIVPLAAFLTILSGVLMLWQLSGGFSSEWMGTPTGVSLSLGGTAAIVAFVIGMAVMRPSALKLLDTAAALGPEGPTADQQRQMEALRRRGGLAAQSVAVLLLVAVAAMAIARYAY